MKNRIVAFALSIFLLATGVWTLSAQTVSGAASNVNVVINGQLLQSDNYSAYKSGATVMIPLREAAAVLKYKAVYQSSTGILQLNGIKDQLEYKPGEQKITINGKDKAVFKEEVLFRQDRLYVPLSFFTAIGLVTAYDTDANQAEIYTPEVTTSAIAGLLAAGKYQELSDRYFSESLKNTITVAQLQQKWESVAAAAGNYYGVKSVLFHGVDH